MEWIKLLRNGNVDILGIRIGVNFNYAKDILTKKGYIVQNGNNCLYIEMINIDNILENINVRFIYNDIEIITEINLNVCPNNAQNGIDIYRKFTFFFKKNSSYFNELELNEVVGRSFINNFSNNLIGVCIFLQYGIEDNKNLYPVSLMINNTFDRKKNFSIDHVKNSIYEIYRNTSPVIVSIAKNKIEHKTRWKEIIQMLLSILLVILIYIISINGRYENLTNGYVLDKWKKEVYHIGTEEMPVRVNGTINNR